MPENYKLGEINTRGREIGTGVKYKARITVKLSYIKSGKKLQPFIISKAA